MIGTKEREKKRIYPVGNNLEEGERREDREVRLNTFILLPFSHLLLPHNPQSPDPPSSVVSQQPMFDVSCHVGVIMVPGDCHVKEKAGIEKSVGRVSESLRTRKVCIYQEPMLM
jgi:hypothetical protein